MGDSSLIPFDERASGEVVYKVLQAHDIQFQFPPKILSDTNTSAWLEKDIWSIELLRIHKGSIGRRITFEWEYVATDQKFDGEFIAEILRRLKTYYFEFERVDYPVVEVDYMAVVPTTTFFRLRDHSIQHSRELVKNGAKLYPLHTKVTTNLELATSARSSKATQSDLDKVDVPPINRPVDTKWY